jgi:hypothetical protein
VKVIFAPTEAGKVESILVISVGGNDTNIKVVAEGKLQAQRL